MNEKYSLTSENLKNAVMDVLSTPPGDSGLEGVLRSFGMERLPSGSYLNIGGGEQGIFETEASAESPETHIFTVDPFLAPGYSLEWYEPDTPEAVPKVAAIAQALPFKEDSFDIVASHAAVPAYLSYDSEQYGLFYQEALRVLKPGGIGYFAPMLREHSDLSAEVLSNLGVEFEVQEFKMSDNHPGRPGQVLSRVIIRK